jgi:hypothetical protein
MQPLGPPALRPAAAVVVVAAAPLQAPLQRSALAVVLSQGVGLVEQGQQRVGVREGVGVAGEGPRVGRR